MANAEIVPFGKYKGQPVEVLAQDKEYCEWLVDQDWFRARYTAIHTLIINNFGAPADTPEHNALQVRFLDDEWATAFVVAALGGVEAIERRFQRHIDSWIRGLDKHAGKVRENAYYAATIADQYEIQISSRYCPHDGDVEKCLEFLTTERAKAKASRWQTDLRIDGLAFECSGTDVVFSVVRWACPDPNGGGRSESWSVECKPSLGDDYPAVLRQMKANNDNALLLGDGGYNGIGATFDQVKKIFAMSQIKIVCLSEVDVAAVRASI